MGTRGWTIGVRGIWNGGGAGVTPGLVSDSSAGAILRQTSTGVLSFFIASATRITSTYALATGEEFYALLYGVSGNYTLDVNGTIDTSSAAAGNFANVGYVGSRAGATFDGALTAYAWDGILPKAERDEWIDNQFCVFAAPKRRTFLGAAGGGVTLSIDDATHGHTADGVSLTQQHQLAVQDASHGHAVDNLSLTQQHQLAVSDATHGHSADNVTLSTELTLSIADALHGHSVDNITLVQQHVLVVADATHGHSADNVVLATGTNLAIADALHAHTVDNLALTQQHVLVVADAFHQHSADNLVLGGLPVAEVEEGGGGPDREESEQPAERFTNDASGWRKPKWVREREQLAAAARISTEEQQDAEPRRASPVAESLAPAVSDSGDAGVAPGLERVSPQPPAIAAPAPQRAAVELERARIAAKVWQQREIEEIMTVLMMAA